MPSKIQEATWDQVKDTLSKMGKAQDGVSQWKLKVQVSRSPVKHSSPQKPLLKKNPKTTTTKRKH